MWKTKLTMGYISIINIVAAVRVIKINVGGTRDIYLSDWLSVKY